MSGRCNKYGDHDSATVRGRQREGVQKRTREMEVRVISFTESKDRLSISIDRIAGPSWLEAHRSVHAVHSDNGGSQG